MDSSAREPGGDGVRVGREALTGGAEDGERVTFETTGTIGRHASSAWAERGFCTHCGSLLFYFLKPTGTYMMSAGVFDDPSPFRLALEIYADHKPEGYALAGEHPRWTEAETLARLAPADG